MPRVTTTKEFATRSIGASFGPYKLTAFRFVEPEYDSPDLKYVVIDDPVIVEHWTRFFKLQIENLESALRTAQRDCPSSTRTALIQEEVLP